MSLFNNNPNEDMSMEDILSSIRKYVAEEDKKEPQSDVDAVYEDEDNSYSDPVIKLGEDNLVGSNSTTPITNPPDSDFNHGGTPLIYEEASTLSESTMYSESKKKSGPFDQLTNALNSYGRKAQKQVSSEKSRVPQTVDQLFRSIAEEVIQHWITNNIRSIVEDMVKKEIEKIKSE